MEAKRIAVLGCTGSVGTQALDVAARNGYDVRAVSCARRIDIAEDTVRRFGVRLCAVSDKEAASRLRAALRDTDCKVIGGDDAAALVAEETDADTVLNAITGVAGLMPTVRTLESGKSLALANKESLVTAGAYVMRLAEKNKKEILPVDSEHCAVWQSLLAGKRSDVKRIILTASGGPFFGYTSEQLSRVKAADALKHPTWKMGAKITVDSATMMNKGFEIIEAAWLFGATADMIDVIVHRESIIHSMVEYKDNMIIAQLGAPDMRSCIQYALTAPDRIEGAAESLDFARLAKMTFYQPDYEVFPLLELAKKAHSLGGTFGAALNGANEAAVAMFLKDGITLPELFRVVTEATLATGGEGEEPEAVLEADRRARAFVSANARKI